MRLTVFGSGSAFGSVGLNAGYCLDGRLLVDCGAPVHVLAARAGIAVAQLRGLLLTHFHFDHCAMLPLLLGARALEVAPPAAPLRIAGPPGTREYLLRLLHTGYGSSLVELVMERLPLEFTTLADGDDQDLDGYRVRSHAVIHGIGPSLAYAVTGPDGATVGFSGDSTDCAGLRRCIAQSDLMVCECTSFEGPVASHLWAGELRELVAAHPRTRFLLSHLAERRPLDGALLAHDLLSLDVVPPGTPLPEPPATLQG